MHRPFGDSNPWMQEIEDHHFQPLQTGFQRDFRKLLVGRSSRGTPPTGAKLGQVQIPRRAVRVSNDIASRVDRSRPWQNVSLSLFFTSLPPLLFSLLVSSMLSTTLLGALLAANSISASPTPRSAPGTYTIPLRRGQVGANGSHLSKRANSSTIALDSSSVSFYADVQIGTPPVTFLALMDTGSSDMFVATAVQSDSCTGGCTITGPLYNPNSSSTAQVSGTSISLTYGIGSDSGVLVQDQVSFGSYSLNQIFVAASSNDHLTTNPSPTALIGLAWQALAETKAVPFVQALWQNGLLAQPLFAFNIGNDKTTSDTGLISGGTLTLGGVDSSVYSGDIHYTALSADQTGFWNIPLSDMAVNGTSLQVTDGAVTIDSGTNSITIDPKLYTYIFEGIPGVRQSSGGSYVYPCSSPVSLSFTFNGTTFTLPASRFQDVNIGSGYCESILQPGQTNDFIIGSPFFESFYTVFRFDPPSVGFAPYKNQFVAGTQTLTGVIATRTGGGQAAATGTGTAAAATGTSTSTSAAATINLRSTFSILLVVGLAFTLFV
ncbi:acid protease [Meredithblackwellia eburnea MCA 4105]